MARTVLARRPTGSLSGRRTGPGSGALVREVDETVPDGLRVDEAHGFLFADRTEEALTGPEHHREDDQAQLVDEVVLEERAPETDNWRRRLSPLPARASLS